MLLSIVMMVKNEERYLDKTLYALNDLRKDIDTELIILDTGSTDSTVEIAKKYTDKAYKLIGQLPDNEYKSMLKEMSRVLLERAY